MTASPFSDAAAKLRRDLPGLEAIELFVTDLNGVCRGKVLPPDALEKIGAGDVRMPVSSLGLDIFGCDVPESGIAIEIGDPDGALLPVAETLTPMLWAERPSAQVIAMMTVADQAAPAMIDPRAALQRIADQAAGMGLTPVVAVEIEFYLIDRARDDAGRAQPPIAPGAGEPLYRQQIYDLAAMQPFEPLLAEIIAASRAAGAPAEAAIAEFGPGQFEINLKHTADAVVAADHAVLLKRAIRGVARKRGFDATFMAKPYGDAAGSGMHVHLSFLDQTGNNIFAAAEVDDQPNAMMSAALGGLLESMPDGMAVFAPHLNSYRRLMPGSYAPLCAAWGTDNRGTAFRCPALTGPGARVEHRVAGADANPYLVVAHVLAGALRGLEKRADPGAPVDGEAAADSGAPLPQTWPDALAAWTRSDFVQTAYGAELARVYAAMKRQEQATLLARVTDAEYDAYLRVV